MLYFAQLTFAAAVLNIHNGVGGAIAADAAGVEKRKFGGNIEIGHMGVAEKHGAHATLQPCIAGDLVAFLYPQSVTVADEKRKPFKIKEFLQRLLQGKIAVAGNAVQRDMGEEGGKGLRVPQMVAKMKDMVRVVEFHGLRHVVNITMGIGENQYFQTASPCLSAPYDNKSAPQ